MRKFIESYRLRKLHQPEVHLWILKLRESAPIGSYARLLSHDSKNKAKTMGNRGARLEYVISRLVVNKILLAYGMWHFRRPALRLRYKFPRSPEYLFWAEKIEISLSHCATALVVAVAHGASVGVDIESFPNQKTLTRGVLRHLKGQEKDAKTNLEIWECWNRKESLLKAAKLGISSLNSLPPLPHRENSIQFRGSSWSINSIRMADGYSLAYAISSLGHRLRYFNLSLNNFNRQ